MAVTYKTELSGWGGYPRVKANVTQPTRLSDLSTSNGQMIMRGQGRSYGDAALSKTGTVVLTSSLDRSISFNDEGLLEAESGTTLFEVLQRLAPEGWFPAVVPGTKFVSLGGSIAADIHGKNHHRDGSFGEHVAEFELLLADQTRRICSPLANSDLFWATVGGMGLTGVITKVKLRLRPIESEFMVVQYQQSRDFDSLLKVLSDKSFDDDYSVVWIDCLAKGSKLGRSIHIRGHHAPASILPERMQNLPPATMKSKFGLNFDLPSWFLNPLSVAAFNELYYRCQSMRRKPFLQHFDSFFFPLDRVRNWNRMYGKRGFVQYQCVFPLAGGAEGLKLLLEELAASRRSGFLAVLKLFGPGNSGHLSFPIEGYTLSLDLPLTDPELFIFLDRLDEIVLRFNGRVYLAKDARMRPEVFWAMYPRLNEWRAIKAAVDPQNRFQSDLSQRLQLDSGATSNRQG